jgi:hypothetical protein
MPVCDLCGAPFEADGYHVVAGGRRFHSIECALRAQAAAKRAPNATSDWIAAARRRLGMDEGTPDVEPERDER